MTQEAYHFAQAEERLRGPSPFARLGMTRVFCGSDRRIESCKPQPSTRELQTSTSKAVRTGSLEFFGAWRLGFGASAKRLPRGGGWGFRRPDSARPSRERRAACLTFLELHPIGLRARKELLHPVGVFERDQLDSSLLMSVGRSESGLERQFAAALRASSSNAGWPLLRRTLFP